MSQFQSTHPRGVRQSDRSDLSHSICFNPRTHAGCDYRPHSIGTDYPVVSIHAPTRGATGWCSRGDGGSQVSIHAPTRGATIGYSFFCRLHNCFNPRTHAGCDHRSQSHGGGCAVSIHAPTRGATRFFGRFMALSEFLCFNPRTHAGCDSVFKLKCAPYNPWRFNPRTHAGCDCRPYDDYSDHFTPVSIHAPTRGATMPISRQFGWTRLRFNPRTHAGCDDRIAPSCQPMVLRFQSTHPRGVRRFLHFRNAPKTDVSIHAPTRGATRRHGESHIGAFW